LAARLEISGIIGHHFAPKLVPEIPHGFGYDVEPAPLLSLASEQAHTRQHPARSVCQADLVDDQ
jgi:hypothetical protein